MTQPLALDSAPHGGAGSWRRGEELIDALAYVDSLAPAERAAVDKLIAEELKSSTRRPSDYLAELPPPYNLNFEEHPLLKEEYARVRAGKAKQEMDTTRYRLDPPPLHRRNDLSAWRAAVENAHSQLEHQYNRLLNLELLLQYGAKAWQAHIAHLEVANKRLVGAAADARKEVEAVNRERKLAQTAAAASLNEGEERWLAAVAKNREIQAACEALEVRASAIQDGLPQRPVPRDPFGIREAAHASADGATFAPSVNSGEPGTMSATDDEHGSTQSVPQAMHE